MMAEIGIDRTIFKGFKVVNIDMVKFNANPQNEDVELELLEDGENLFKKIKIKDKTIGCLECDITTNKLTLFSDKFNNLHPLSVSQYRNRIEEAFNDLRNIYGIDTQYRFDKLILNQIEINATIEMDNEFNTYNRLIDVLIDGVADEKQAQFYVKKREDKIRKLGTAFISDNSRKVIIYDKSEQLGDTRGYKPDKNYLRLEYSFKKKETFNSSIGTTVADLTDKKINDFFFKNFDKDFIERFNKYRVITQAELVDLVYDSYNKSKKNWRCEFLLNISGLEKNTGILRYSTIEDVIQAIKTAHNKHKIFKRYDNIINDYKKFCKKNNITHDSQNMVDEFFDKINSLRTESESNVSSINNNSITEITTTYETCVEETNESLRKDSVIEECEDLSNNDTIKPTSNLGKNNSRREIPVYDEEEHILVYVYPEIKSDEADDYWGITDENSSALYKNNNKNTKTCKDSVILPDGRLF